MVVAQTQKDLQEKELLQKSKIITMRKDLQRLREADIVRESSKIIGMKTADKEAGKKDIEKKIEIKEKTTPKVTHVTKERENLETILQKTQQEEYRTMAHLKEYANEVEKQQIFLFESQKIELENQLKSIGKNGKPPILLEKNETLVEREKLQKEVNPLIKQEEEIEIKQRNIENAEKESRVPSEKEALDKTRWGMEEQRQKIERKRWSTEEQIKKLGDKAKNLDEDYKKLTDKEIELKGKIQEINNALKEIYSDISKREKTKQEKLRQEEKLENIKKSREISQSQATKEIPITVKKNIPTPPQVSKPKEKEFLKEAPLSIKEKFRDLSRTEEEQRRKFLEEIEKWVSVAKDNNQQSK